MRRQSRSVDASDMMCPWCYIGLRKLQEASKIANVDANIVWKPYMLRPNLPEVRPPLPVWGVISRLLGESVGINFTGLTDKTPNTGLFHATMKWIKDTGKGWEETDEASFVFDAYITIVASLAFPCCSQAMSFQRTAKDKNPSHSLISIRPKRRNSLQWPPQLRLCSSSCRCLSKGYGVRKTLNVNKRDPPVTPQGRRAKKILCS